LVCSETQPIGMSTKEWEKLETQERSLIQICHADLVLLNILGEYLDKKLCQEM
jgi:hypothetical protein